MTRRERLQEAALEILSSGVLKFEEYMILMGEWVDQNPMTVPEMSRSFCSELMRSDKELMKVENQLKLFQKTIEQVAYHLQSNKIADTTILRDIIFSAKESFEKI